MINKETVEFCPQGSGIMKRIKRIQILLFILVLVNGAIAQTTNKTLTIKNNREKLILNTDRTIYTNGEEVFFSVKYMLNGNYSKQQLSNVLYLELINDNYESIVQKKFKIHQNRTNGVIRIPFDAYTGNYLLRCYTQFQRNLDNPNFSYNRISVINPKISPKKNVKTQKEPIIILPEGGTIAEGINNKIGVYVNDSVNVLTKSIFIEDQKNNVVKNLAPDKSGIYLFNLNPSDSASYRLKIKYQNGDSLLKEIPEAKKYAIKTNIEQNDGTIQYSLYEKYPGRKEFSGYSLDILTSDYRIINQAVIPSFKDSITLSFDKSKLEDGLLYFILQKKKESITRINTCYSLSKKTSKIKIQTDRNRYKTREKVKVDVSIDNTDIDSIPATITVIRKGTLNKGSGISPYIFHNANLMENILNTKKALGQTESKLLKAGSIRLDHTINNDKFYTFLQNLSQTKLDRIPEIRDITINGILRNLKTKEPIPEKKLYVSVLFKNQQFHVCKTNENGKFLLSLNDIKELNDLYLCPVLNDGNTNAEILIRNVFTPSAPDFPIGIYSPDTLDIRLIEEIITNHRIQQIIQKNRPSNDTHTNKNNGFNFLNPTTITKLDDYVSFKYMNNVFTEIVPNVYVKRTKGKYWFKVERENGQPLPGEPLVLIDNIPVLDINKIMEIHPSQIESIGVIPKSYIIGEYTLNGVIMINSKTDNFAGIEFPKGSTFLEYLGVSRQQKYHQNTYLAETEKQSNIPDFRTTLYWNPNRTLTINKYSFNFFTSDRKGEYEIIVRGYSKDGKYYTARKSIIIH